MLLSLLMSQSRVPFILMVTSACLQENCLDQTKNITVLEKKITVLVTISYTYVTMIYDSGAGCVACGDAQLLDESSIKRYIINCILQNKYSPAKCKKKSHRQEKIYRGSLLEV